MASSFAARRANTGRNSRHTPSRKRLPQLYERRTRKHRLRRGLHLVTKRSHAMVEYNARPNSNPHSLWARIQIDDYFVALRVNNIYRRMTPFTNCSDTSIWICASKKLSENISFRDCLFQRDHSETSLLVVLLSAFLHGDSFGLRSNGTVTIGVAGVVHRLMLT